MLRELLTHPDVVDTAKAMPAAALTGAWWLHLDISWAGEAFQVIIGAYSLIVALEKFYKASLWLAKKFSRKPSE